MMDGTKKSDETKEQPTEKPFAVSAPQIALPKGGGAISGIGEKFQANPVTGTGSLTVPIALSPGRSGVGPQLAVLYDSGAGNGPFGLGWSLSLPMITRKTDKGLPQYDDAGESDVFILFGHEDLMPLLVQDAEGGWRRDPIVRDGYTVWRYRPRIEGLFSRIERWTRQSDGDTYWRSISRDNVTTFYGKTPASRVADTTDTRRVFTWLICESRDDKGNAIIYEYVAEDSAGIDFAQANERNRSDASRATNRYLKRIKYGNTISTLVQPDLSQASWLFEVVFDYGEGHLTSLPTDSEGRAFAAASIDPMQAWPARLDPFSRYRACFEVRTYRLCRRVLMFHHFADDLGTPDYLVRATEFAYTEGAVASFITGVTQSGFVRQSDGSYLRRSLPSLEFQYSQASVQSDVQEVDPQSLANLPANVDGTQYQWLDLDGEGVAGVLASYEDVWYYKRNLSPLTQQYQADQPTISARFETLTEVAKLPGFAQAKTARHQFLDLAGDGHQDCVVLERPNPGFYKRTDEADWENFALLDSVPNIDWNDPNLRFIDLNGDGHADVLVTEHNVFTWYPSLAETGFDTGLRVATPTDEEKGPAIIFADGTQSIFLADMTGDGLSDIVRIRNGEVCHWPNIGYGEFGAKVTMDNAPWFDSPDLFDPRRVRLADIDGCGTTDIIYLGPQAVRLYFNQAGNTWSEPETLPAFPRIDNLASVQAMDLLGNGTSCLVWMSTLPNDTRRSMRYVDLMGGQKPHLLISSSNNLGAETRVRYAPSTKFYLADREAGQPWATRLAFPVQVVERVETYDWISRNRFITRYAYHHGYFDGIEREFRGFGMVEQRDTEELGVLTQSGAFPNAVNIDAASYVPPVLTKTWFHIGAYPMGRWVSKVFASEYWREPNLSDAQWQSLQLPDSALPPDLSDEEIREALRALKGSILRQEVYALDGTTLETMPYTVSERNYCISRLQPFGINRHAVFFTRALESVNFQYERTLYSVGGVLLADPRTTHKATLEVDEYGNELQSTSIAYGRRYGDPDPLLTLADHFIQAKTQITYTQRAFTNAILASDAFRSPLPAEVCTYELINIAPSANELDSGVTDLLRFDDLVAHIAQASDGHHDLPYEDINAIGTTTSDPYRRIIEQVRTLYRKDDLTNGLPLGKVESLALPFVSYKCALTPGLLALYQRGSENLLPDSAAVLGAAGGYALSDDQITSGQFPSTDPSGNWWIPSGTVFYSANAADPALTESTEARAHFFQPRRVLDPFGNATTVTPDAHDLLPEQILDPVENVVSAINDYRVLQPATVTDPNGNQSAVAFDALGLVVGTAVMDKSIRGPQDSLAEFVADLSQTQIDAFIADPVAQAEALLGNATTRIVYDPFRFTQSAVAPAEPGPCFAATISRETHVQNLAVSQTSRLQLGISYSDGLGRAVQRKAYVEAGPLLPGGPAVQSRWIGSGWTIFNNKGKSVRQYEPFFAASPDFSFGTAIGVTSTLFYDPVGRAVATLHPNQTWEKVVFNPWRQQSWDTNDTVLITDPGSDADVGPYFQRIPSSDYLPTWYTQRNAGGLGSDEQDAAEKAAVHAGTFSTAQFDTLGRVFLTVAFNRYVTNGSAVESHDRTTVAFDIEGNQRSITDARDRQIMTYDYDMLGSKIGSSSVDSGQRWTLNDATGKPLILWDSRNHRLRRQYDAARRPTNLFVQTGTGPEAEAERSAYGEGQANDQTLNLRGRLYQQFDGAGVVTHTLFDFKGNLLSANQQLILKQDFTEVVDWSQSNTLDRPFRSSTAFDALNRPIKTTAPDGSVLSPAYNQNGLLTKVNGVLATPSSTATPLEFVSNISYDAKGQRQAINYGNGVSTVYTYDPLTFRLMNLYTARSTASFPGDDPTPLIPPRGVQNLSYSYDPVGNVTQIKDSAQQTIYYDNAQVAPLMAYTYDALYRLIQATGREAIGQIAQPQTTYDDSPRMNQPLPNDWSAMRNYTETYQYDAVGNFLALIHGTASGNWTRTYAYDEPNLPATNNRLTSTTVGTTKEPYTYDAHGNMLTMPQLVSMAWDFKDQLQATQKQVVNGAPGPQTYYVYDNAGQRVRKVNVNVNGSVANERIYLGGFEVYREYANGAISLERQTLHIMDDKQRIALVESLTQGSDGSPPQLIRYQFSNHLGSASLELDAGANVISYEEYYPYGNTSYQATNSNIKATAKRYRYVGKERDEETGFTAYGERYYVDWLGVWASCDPGALVDSLSLYTFCRCSPVSRRDTGGRQSVSATSPPDLHAGAVTATVLSPQTRVQMMGQINKDFGIPETGYPNEKSLVRQFWFEGERYTPKAAGEVPTDIGFFSGDRRPWSLLSILSRAQPEFLPSGESLPNAGGISANLSRAQQFIPDMDPSLVLAIGFRESHESVALTGGTSNTFLGGGLDALFANKDKLNLPTSVTGAWHEDTSLAGRPNPEDPTGKTLMFPAFIPNKDLLLGYAATIRMNNRTFEAFIKARLGDTQGQEALNNLKPDARRVWEALAFSTPGGAWSLEHVSIGFDFKNFHFGVQTVAGEIIRRAHLNDKNAKVDLNAILTADGLFDQSDVVRLAKTTAAQAKYLDKISK